MAFKRSNFKSLVSTKKEYFASSYNLKNKANFKEGSDVYVIPLGLETGFYETPCHRVIPHKIDGKTIGFNGSQYAVNIKCKGIDADGNTTSSLCCTIAKLEKERFSDSNEYAKRIVSSRTIRIHLPILILGNSLNDDSKISYPISKVALKKELASEGGLRFSYLDLSATTFKKDILNAYGKKLQEDGILDYDLAEDSEDFMMEVVKRLENTIIKIHGGTKPGFAAVKEYSFFPLDNPAIASQSPEGERDLIVNFKKNAKINQQISEQLTLFDSEVDNLVNNWTEKDLQEYYNSALGVPLSTPIGEAASIKKQIAEKAEASKEPEETVVVKKAEPKKAEPVEEIDEGTTKEISMDEPTKKLDPPASAEEIQEFINNPYDDEESASEGEVTKEAVEELDEFEYDLDGDDEFFN